MSAHPVVRAGQVWASTDPRDIREGLRQRRHVVSADARWALLRTEQPEGRRVVTNRISLTRDGILRHRLVEDASEERAT